MSTKQTDMLVGLDGGQNGYFPQALCKAPLQEALSIHSYQFDTIMVQ